MKKRKVASFIGFLLLFACTTSNKPTGVMPDQLLADYMDGKIVLSVGDAYDLYDQDTSGVIFLDLRDQQMFSKSHELGAVCLPYSDLIKVNRKSFSERKDQTLLLYSDQFSKALDAWFLLQQRGISNAKVILGNFDPAAGMLIDISTEPRYDYLAELEKAKEKFKSVPSEAPTIIAPKKVVAKKKKKVVEEEEGC